MSDKGTGNRFNTGKIKYNLLPPFALEQYAKAMTMGADKYGDRNWEKGMNWDSVTASMKRHIAAFEKGQDYDSESNLLHMAHVMCNAGFLLEYYKLFPEGDNRTNKYPFYKNVGLDIDQVVCDFVGGMYDYFQEPKKEVLFWNDPFIVEHFPEIKDDEEFWLGLPALIDPKDLKFEPTCFITSRCIPTEISERWLREKGFPNVPVETVGLKNSKVEAAKKHGVEIFIDDHIKNFVEMNEAGITCYLKSTSYNTKYDVGYKRICNVNEILEK